jgi:hypothetical protein
MVIFYTFIIWIITSVISFSQTTTTSNLTSSTFTTANGWSGTNLYSTHGSNTIAGVSGKYIENTISLTNVGLSQAQINEGFTSTQGADIWFWSGNQNQNVTMTQIITDANGGVTTQNKIIPYASSYFNTYTNLAVVDKNIQANYSITSKFSFYESTNSPFHYAADLNNPTLSITYITNPTPPIVIAPIEIVTPIIEQIKITEPVVVAIIEAPVIESPIVVQQSPEPTKINETIQLAQPAPEQPKQSTEQPKEVNKEQTQNKEESIKEQKSTKEELPTAKENTTVSSSEDKSAKTSVSEEKPVATSTQQEVKTKLTDSKVGTEVKIAEVKVKSVQEIKIDALKVNQPSLSAYESKPFYQQKQIVGIPNPNFFMQLQLEQKPIYVNVNLNDYISKDPLVARQNMLKQIQDEEDDIIIQLEQLRKTKG